MLCGFVIWVLKEAQRRGIRTLYFLSRDGWMMAEAAKRLCGALGVRMEIRYLYCSRLSLHRAYAHIDMEKALRLLLRPSLQMTPRSLIARTMLPAQQQEACLRQLALPCGPDAPLTPDQGDELRKRLCSDPAFVRWMSAEAKAAYDALQGYLKQEGLEEGAYAIVDSGWIGSLQMTLSAMCEAMGLPQPQGFYFGLSRLQPGADPAAYHAYFFSPFSDLRRRAFFVPALFEAVYGAPHGMCAGYRQEAGRWVPVCLKQDEQAIRWAKALGAQIALMRISLPRAICARSAMNEMPRWLTACCICSWSGRRRGKPRGWALFASGMTRCIRMESWRQNSRMMRCGRMRCLAGSSRR